MKRNLVGKWLMYLILWGGFYWVGVTNLDPDFGWYVRAGRQYLGGAVIIKDTFSYTMPEYEWIDNGRGIASLIAWGFDNLGYEGLALGFGFIAVVSIYLVVGRRGGWNILYPLTLVLPILLSRFGIRTQIVDWLFMAVVWAILTKEGKLVWLVPLVFMVWANLHGGFLLGLIVCGIRVMVGIVEKKHRGKYLVITSLAVGATLINPYGFRLWEEVARTGLSSQLKMGVVEWYPAWKIVDINFWILAGVMGYLLWRLRNKYSLFEKITGGVFFVMGVGALRFGPIFGLMATVIVVKGLDIMKVKGRTRMVLLVGCVVLLLVNINRLKPKFIYNKMAMYPVGAVEYLKANPDQREVFSEYMWGGFMDWKYPEKKVFVDGRMPTWIQKGSKVVSESAFVDYKKIRAEGEYGGLFNKYNIGSVVLMNPDNYGKDVLVDKLKSDGWLVKYKDGLSVVLGKPI